MSRDVDGDLLLQEIQRSRDTLIKVAAYADPPGACKSDESVHITSNPHGWSSNAVDQIKANNIEFRGFTTKPKIIDAVWDEKGGPVVLLSATIGELFDFNDCENSIEYEWGAVCASIEWNPSQSAILVGGIPALVCADVRVVGFLKLTIDEGCNPAGEIVIPGGAKFTTLLQKRQLSVKERDSRWDDGCRTKVNQWNNRCKLTPKLVKSLFPDQDFACNAILDRWARRARPLGVYFHRVPKSLT